MAIRFGNGFGIGTSNGGGAGVSQYWSNSTVGYTELTGGVTANDDGYFNNAITLPYNFWLNNVDSNQLWVSTNGVISLDTGYSNCCPSSPQDNSNLFAGNPGDQELIPGTSLSDGTSMGAWYKITDYGADVFKIEIKVNNKELDDSGIMSYQVNLYRDGNYQYMESWVKITPSTYEGVTTMGPYNFETDISVPTSKTRNTWRGDLNGLNWTSLGNVAAPFTSTGGLIVTISEVGSDVVMTASGTINTNGLTQIYTNQGPMATGGLVGIYNGLFMIAPNNPYFDIYSGFTSTPSNFGTGGGNAVTSTTTGDFIAVIIDGIDHWLELPAGYVSGTQIDSSLTLTGVTFSSLGLTPGTYTYSWGIGANADVINVVVG